MAAIIPVIPNTFINGQRTNANTVDENFTTIQDNVNANAAHNGVNSDITELLALVDLSMSGDLNVGGDTTLQGILEVFGDVFFESTGAVKIPNGGTGFRPPAPVLGMMRYNTTTQTYEAYTQAGWVPFLNSAPVTVGGRLSLTTAVPVQSSAVIGAGTVYFTPYNSNWFPVWTGESWVPVPLPELSQALTDATKSPAAAAAASVYDLFVWQDTGGVTRLSRGPAWTNTTTRGYTLTNVFGVLTNTSAITNGPAAGFGVFVGTIATDPAAATVTFNPTPAAAAGGGNAWVGIWNNYNRVSQGMQSFDNTTSWTHTGTTWAELNASAANRLTFVVGQVEDFTQFSFSGLAVTSANNAALGVGVNSTTTPASVAFTGSGTTLSASGTPVGVVRPGVGLNFLQALENGTATFYGTDPVFSAQANSFAATIRG